MTGNHAMQKGSISSNLLTRKSQGMKQQDLQTNAVFSQEDIARLQKIHLESTGVLLSIQETIEMGIRIKNMVKLVYKPIPEL